MTIICVRDGIMAADSAVWSGDVVVGHAIKILRGRGNALIGCAGAFAATKRFRDWWADVGPYSARYGIETFLPNASEDSGFAALVLDPDGVLYFDEKGNVIDESGFPFSVTGDDTAIAIATGAMCAGASAAEAVEICIKRASYARGTVQVMSLQKQEGDHGESSRQEAGAV